MIEQKPLLTIAIPTYDRNDKIVRSLAVLGPQMDARVNILILDNCSPVPVGDTIEELLRPGIKVVRNKVNIGMSANIIRCFESCETEWMWLLGDDDVPTADAIAGILEDIEVNHDCVFLNYKSPLCKQRITPFYTNGQEDLISKLDDFGNLLFISVGVYNINNLIGDMRLMYQLSYCIAPHLVFLLSGLKSGKKAGFLTREIHDFHLRNTTEAENWSWISLSLCISILYEIPLNISELAKKKFAQYVLTHVKSPHEIYDLLQHQKYYNLPITEKRYLLRQIFFRSKLYSGLSFDIFFYLWYDLKLVLKNKIFHQRVISSVFVDERI